MKEDDSGSPDLHVRFWRKDGDESDSLSGSLVALTAEGISFRTPEELREDDVITIGVRSFHRAHDLCTHMLAAEIIRVEKVHGEFFVCAQFVDGSQAEADERRSDLRRGVRLHGELTLRGETLDCEVIDVSTRGVKFLTPFRMEPGEKAVIRLGADRNQVFKDSLDLALTVVRSTETDGGSFENGAEIEFLRSKQM